MNLNSFSLRRKLSLYNAQGIEQLKRNNLQLIEKWKSELIKLEHDLKKSDFGVAEDSINLLNDSFTVAKYIVAEDLVKIEQFFVTQYVKTLEHKYAAYSSSGISVEDNAFNFSFIRNSHSIKYFDNFCLFINMTCFGHVNIFRLYDYWYSFLLALENRFECNSFIRVNKLFLH